MPGNKPTPDQWSAEAKLSIVIETGAMSEAELSEYCRAKGLYVEQVKAWKAETAALLVLRKTCLEQVFAQPRSG